MTLPARITQDDIDRAMKAVKKAEIGCARVIMNLNKQTIEIIIGESGGDQAAPTTEEWPDDD